jgi:hypothetical protein
VRNETAGFQRHAKHRQQIYEQRCQEECTVEKRCSRFCRKEVKNWKRMSCAIWHRSLVKLYHRIKKNPAASTVRSTLIMVATGMFLPNTSVSRPVKNNFHSPHSKNFQTFRVRNCRLHAAPITSSWTVSPQWHFVNMKLLLSTLFSPPVWHFLLSHPNIPLSTLFSNTLKLVLI